jgi:hypothetical protein
MSDAKTYLDGVNVERCVTCKQVIQHPPVVEPPSPVPEHKVTRLEVIDETGRKLTLWNCGITFSYQDDGRTLKIFVAPADTAERETR